jgi:hypothetical protein
MEPEVSSPCSQERALNFTELIIKILRKETKIKFVNWKTVSGHSVCFERRD